MVLSCWGGGGPFLVKLWKLQKNKIIGGAKNLRIENIFDKINGAGPESQNEGVEMAKRKCRKTLMSDEYRDVKFQSFCFSPFWHSSFGVWT